MRRTQCSEGTNTITTFFRLLFSSRQKRKGFAHQPFPWNATQKFKSFTRLLLIRQMERKDNFQKYKCISETYRCITLNYATSVKRKVCLSWKNINKLGKVIAKMENRCTTSLSHGKDIKRHNSAFFFFFFHLSSKTNVALACLEGWDGSLHWAGGKTHQLSF